MPHVSQGIIGRIYRVEDGRFDWNLGDFFSLSAECNHYYQSPAFIFADNPWCLRLYANGYGSLEGWISLFLEFKEKSSKHIHFTLGVKTTKTNLEEFYGNCHTFDKEKQYAGLQMTINRSKLLGRESELAPSNCLTFTVIMSTQYPRMNLGLRRVVKDFGRLLVSGDNSDVTVQVGDVQLNAHKLILAARSPVLAAMFQHETKEKIFNKISINDCEPDIFKEFLHFIYTGTVQHLTSQNVFSLHRVADKYLANDLKLQCLIYMQDALCVETFCDTVQLARMHGETELLQIAMKFASKNIASIIRSVEWQNFIRDRPTEANEILIKSIQPIFNQLPAHGRTAKTCTLSVSKSSFPSNVLFPLTSKCQVSLLFEFPK